MEIGSHWEISLGFAFHNHSLPPILPQSLWFFSAWWLLSPLSCPAAPARWPAPCQQLALPFVLLGRVISVSLWLPCFLSACPFHLIVHLLTLQRLLYTHCFGLYLAVQFGKCFSPSDYHESWQYARQEYSSESFTINLLRACTWIKMSKHTLRKWIGFQ